MGNRLSKIYTKTGDDGTSGLADGARLPKNHARMEAMGSVDELNSVIGLMICKLPNEDLEKAYTEIQHDLFNIGGEISMPGHSFITEEKVANLELRIDKMNESISPLKDFILPGGSEAASICHIARATARRAERDLVTLHQAEPISDTTRSYINRLSDLLFVTARIINKSVGKADVLWRKELS
ncbi:MAG: cob(I)yrinic acid a,c-diamide adenosyltransferase [Acidiferrobacterales bacterium]|nr:cob(I)yrinic acid a,c-diamide adenosyltransferase [Acidiferrobacterales bacterium]